MGRALLYGEVRIMGDVFGTSCVDDRLLKPVVLHLFEKLYKRRQRIRMIGIQFGKLVHEHPQMNLFDDQAKSLRLLQEMDGIRKRFGKGAI